MEFMTEAQAHMLSIAVMLGLQVTRTTIHPHSGALTLYGPIDNTGTAALRIIEQDGRESYRRHGA